MSHAEKNERPFRSRLHENPVASPACSGPVGSCGTPADHPRPGKDEKGLTPAERAALERSMQRHRKALDLLAQH